jgi:hypothetical protein
MFISVYLNFSEYKQYEISGFLIERTIESKEAARIGYNRFLFPHEYSDEGRGA